MAVDVPLIDVHAHPMFPIGVGVRLAEQPKWSVEGTLSLLDEQHIAATVLSIPDAANYAEAVEARDIARRINDKLADTVARAPSRFGAFATVPGRDPDGALREIEYALDVLGLDGVCTSTNIADVYLGDRRYDAWFDEMNRRGVTLFIHPMALSTSDATDLGVNVSVLEFMFDTTRMLLNMVLTGRKERFSAIRMIATHAGGTIPFLLERVKTLLPLLGSGEDRAPISPEAIHDVLASFYYDLTASTSRAQLVGLLDLVGPGHLLMGFDSPLMPATSIKPAISAVHDHPGLSTADRHAIRSGNAIALFPQLARRISHASAVDQNNERS